MTIAGVREMNDRELLEMAARALGYKAVEWQKGFGMVAIGQPEKSNQMFNPLEYDGHAFRLAVDLGIGVQSYSALKYSHAGAETINQSIAIKEQHLVDPYAATRRAIVLAAAEIGKNMP